jgi:hypothetical protein
MNSGFETRDVPPTAARCYLAVTAVVAYGIQSSAPPEAYVTLAAITTAIAVWARPRGDLPQQ